MNWRHGTYENCPHNILSVGSRSCNIRTRGFSIVTLWWHQNWGVVPPALGNGRCYRWDSSKHSASIVGRRSQKTNRMRACRDDQFLPSGDVCFGSFPCSLHPCARLHVPGTLAHAPSRQARSPFRLQLALTNRSGSAGILAAISLLGFYRLPFGSFSLRSI